MIKKILEKIILRKLNKSRKEIKSGEGKVLKSLKDIEKE